MTPGVRTAGLTTETVTDPAGFAALAEEWAALHRAAPRATPFQGFGWLAAWVQAYRPRRLRVVLVRDDGRLVAAAPLHLRRRGAVRVLAPIGGAITDATDVLLAEDDLPPGRLAAVVAALVSGVRDVPGWDVLDLPEVPPGAAAELVLDAWAGPRWALPSSTCAELHAASFDELLTRLPGKKASEVRRRLRRADELGLELTAVPAGEAAAGVEDLLRLHARQWEGRGINPEHLRPRFAAHLTRALEVMIADGSAVLTRYRLDGEPVAVTLDLVGGGTVGGYLMGGAPELFDRIDLTVYILREELRRTAASGAGVFSMLRGRESYKDRWRPVVVRHRRVLLGRAAAAHPYAGAVLARARAVGVARERAPWLRDARWLRGVRNRLAAARRP